MQSKEMQKVVYRDGEITKAITCEILSEDNFLLTVKAERTGIIMRIGKAAIISIKPIVGGQ